MAFDFNVVYHTYPHAHLQPYNFEKQTNMLERHFLYIRSGNIKCTAKRWKKERNVLLPTNNRHSRSDHSYVLQLEYTNRYLFREKVIVCADDSVMFIFKLFSFFFPLSVICQRSRCQLCADA